MNAVTSLKNAFLTRNLESQEMPDLEDLAGEYDLDYKLVRSQAQAENWFGLRKTQVDMFHEQVESERNIIRSGMALDLAKEKEKILKESFLFLENRKLVIDSLMEDLENGHLKPKDKIALFGALQSVQKEVLNEIDRVEKATKGLPESDNILEEMLNEFSTKKQIITALQNGEHIPDDTDSFRESILDSWSTNQ